MPEAVAVLALSGFPLWLSRHAGDHAALWQFVESDECFPREGHRFRGFGFHLASHGHLGTSPLMAALLAAFEPYRSDRLDRKAARFRKFSATVAVPGQEGQ